MDFTKILRNHWFTLNSVTLVMTNKLNSKERPTKTRQNVKICFKLSQTHGKSPFPGWNQQSNSLKWWPRDDRYIEFLEIHGFHQKHLEIIDFHWFRWLWWSLAISIVRNDLPKPCRTWKYVSNFLKRSGKVHFRGGINFPIVWSRDLVMIVTSSILKSMDFIKILDYQGFLRYMYTYKSCIAGLAGELVTRAKYTALRTHNWRRRCGVVLNRFHNCQPHRTLFQKYENLDFSNFRILKSRIFADAWCMMRHLTYSGC